MKGIWHTTKLHSYMRGSKKKIRGGGCRGLTLFAGWGVFFIFTNLTMQIKEFWILCRGSEPAPLDLRRWVSHTNILFPQRSLWDLFRENIPPQKLLLEFSKCHYQKKKKKRQNGLQRYLSDYKGWSTNYWIFLNVYTHLLLFYRNTCIKPFALESL